ncbi:aminotransferase class I/II-fold pyridoxal phosphate-dependent enzyme [Actinokineospora cianjurensis]|uniref:Enduracididine biosynthesis enzyme MppQ n=1 Tax=Actinokineospora cianjurensis TaxID=585224 RepID=A0A421B0Y8_9PSEU|nr:aminotransferase class I/II-fold pyridoxal phosphate-dependent enzyme [Actinokineospora cianjurensis]RLK57998.1 enduracididine biosynthesis enzyme MppQ [Actinokineospora cianjurensis]
MTAAHRAGALSHTRRWDTTVVQAVSRPGVLDLGPGYLEPDLLPVDLVRDAYATALAEFGAAALSYGADQGNEVLRAGLAAREAAASGYPCGPEHVLVTAGTSQALHLVGTAMAAPGDTVLVDRLSYDFGRRVLTDHGLRLREVRLDEGGMDPRALHEALTAERAAGRHVGFVLLNPTFHNPTGTLVGTDRRRELLAVAALHGVLVVEDDAYAELGLDGTDLPPSLASLAEYDGVIRLGTFAKTIGPGLRLGWLVAHPAVVTGLARRGTFVSGGCVNHTTSLAIATLVRDGHYDRRLDWLRACLRERRDALVNALRAEADDLAEFTTPGGGFFLWLRFPPERTEADLLAAAAAVGVNAAAGSRFGTTAGPAIRLAYSFTPPDGLAEAAARLAAAWRPTAGPGQRRHP